MNRLACEEIKHPAFGYTSGDRAGSELGGVLIGAHGWGGQSSYLSSRLLKCDTIRKCPEIFPAGGRTTLYSHQGSFFTAGIQSMWTQISLSLVLKWKDLDKHWLYTDWLTQPSCPCKLECWPAAGACLLPGRLSADFYCLLVHSLVIGSSPKVKPTKDNVCFFPPFNAKMNI